MKPGLSRTATIVPHSVNIECATCRTPLFEGVIAADENIPWRQTHICENCGNPARIPASPFGPVFMGANAVNGR